MVPLKQGSEVAPHVSLTLLHQAEQLNSTIFYFFPFLPMNSLILPYSKALSHDDDSACHTKNKNKIVMCFHLSSVSELVFIFSVWHAL